MDNDGCLGPILVALMTIVLGIIVWVAGFQAGMNSYQRHACEQQELEWINEEPIRQPIEGHYDLGVTCVEPIQRVSP